MAKKTAADIIRAQADDARKSGDTSRADQLNAAASQMDRSDRSDTHTGVTNTGTVRGSIQNGNGGGSSQTQSGCGWFRRKG